MFRFINAEVVRLLMRYMPIGPLASYGLWLPMFELALYHPYCRLFDVVCGAKGLIAECGKN